MPTPVITHNQLGWAFMSSFVSTVKTPSLFLTQAYFGTVDGENLPTESVELSYKEGDRNMAPFVEVNGEAITVGGRSVTFANVSAPNIRIKRPMEAYTSLLRRQPGTGIHITGGDVVARARQEAMAEDASYMAELIDNRVEWMTSQWLTGTTSGQLKLSYTATEKANFTITIPRHTDMTVSLAGGAAEWDDNDGKGIAMDFHNAKRAFSRHLNTTVRMCIMGKNAATHFLNAAGVKDILDKKNVSAGTLELQNQFGENGAIYLGTFAGVPCWEYAREYVNDAGSVAPYIPDDIAVFLAGGNNEGKIFNGAIPDHDAFDEGLFMSKRFSKAWKEKDPPVYVQLVHARPLPMIRKPNSIYVLTVT